MRSLTITVFALAAATLAAPVQAQSGWGMAPPGGGGFALPRGGSEGDWLRCTNVDRIHPLERSVESCNRMLAERPGHLVSGAIYWYRAMRYQDAGQFSEAEADLNLAAGAFATAIEANPRDYYGYSNRASVRARLGQYDEALADYTYAATIDSNASSPWLGRGNILFRRGDYAGASEAFDRAGRIAARVASTGPAHHTVRCAVRAAANVDLDRARTFCDRAVRNADNPSYALAGRGYFWFMQGDLTAAAADFSRAIEEDPYNAPAVYGRGVVAAREGRTAEGEADMARGLAMDRFEVEYYANAGLRP